MIHIYVNDLHNFSYKVVNWDTCSTLHRFVDDIIQTLQLQVWKQYRMLIDLLCSHTTDLDHNILVYLRQCWNPLFINADRSVSMNWSPSWRLGTKAGDSHPSCMITQLECKSPGTGLCKGWIVTALSNHSIPNWHAQDYFHVAFLLLPQSFI